jgi:N-acyl-D-aspartate/D-glutamate deacylase
VQHARGIAATIVNGAVLLRDGKPTGALPGRLLRSRLGQRQSRRSVGVAAGGGG